VSRRRWCRSPPPGSAAAAAPPAAGEPVPPPAGAPSDRRDSLGREEVRSHVRALRSPCRLSTRGCRAVGRQGQRRRRHPQDAHARVARGERALARGRAPVRRRSGGTSRGPGRSRCALGAAPEHGFNSNLLPRCLISVWVPPQPATRGMRGRTGVDEASGSWQCVASEVCLSQGKSIRDKRSWACVLMPSWPRQAGREGR
jgi:hypothetical protein